MFAYFVIACLVSCAVAIFIIRFEHFHSFTADHDLTGPQKFHSVPVPRVGGVPIMCGLVVATIMQTWGSNDVMPWYVLLAALPAWGVGLLEDLCKKVGVTARLVATFVSALVGYWLLDAVMPRLDVPWLDDVYQMYIVIPVLFTMVTVGGVAHAINIVDGYNGLSGIVALMFLFAFGYVAFHLDDWFVLALCVSLAGAILGFLIWNYPAGLIFAGDGGAYLIGFLLAEIAVLLCFRHQTQVSPWFPLLVVIYPVFETLFSIYRKRYVRGQSPGMPDGLHFHMLIYKRLVRWMVGSKEARHRKQRNSLTSPYLWATAGFSVVPAVMFWDSPAVLAAFVLLFCIAYIWLYNRIVRFRVPRVLVINKKYKRNLPRVPEEP